MGICASNSMQTDIGFAADKGGKGDDGRRAALDMFQIDRNFKRVVHKKKTKTRELLTNKLQKHPLFEALGAKELSELVDAMQSVSVAPKENLISRGAAMNEMYILEVGELTGVRHGRKGKPDRTKAFDEGAIIGDKALLSEQVSQATVYCSGVAAATVWAIDGATYRNVLAANGERVMQLTRVKQALTASPLLRKLPPHVLQSLAEAALKPTPLAAGAAVPLVGPKLAVEQLWLVVRGQVRCSMALRPDGGESAVLKKRRRPAAGPLLSGGESAWPRFEPSAFEPTPSHRAYDCGAGQLVGLHAFACGLPVHLEQCVAVAAQGGVEMVPVPLEAVGPHLSPALREGAMMTEVCERVLTTKPEFAAFPQAVLKVLCEAAPVQTYRAGECVLKQGDLSHFLFVVRVGKLMVCHADRTLRSAGGPSSMAQLAAEKELLNPLGGGSGSSSGTRVGGRLKSKRSGDSSGGSSKGGKESSRGGNIDGEDDADDNSSANGGGGSGGGSRRGKNSSRGSSGRGGSRGDSSGSMGKGATEDELLASLAGELQGMAEMPSAIPPRSGNISVDKDEVRTLLGPGDTLGVPLMKPLDASAAAAVRTGGDAAAGATAAQKSAQLARASGEWEDGSVMMKDSIIACSRVELMVVSRDLFMKALNVSLSILKRRNRDREKRRAQSVAGTRASAVGNNNTTNGRQSIYGAGGVIGEKAVPADNAGSSKNGNGNKGGKHGGSSHVGVAQEGGGGGDGKGGGNGGDGQGGDGPIMDEEEAIAAGLALTTSWPWLAEPAIKLSNLREVKVLGRGAFGLVRCVRDKGSNREFALKALAKPAVKASSGGRGLEKMVRERDAQVLCGTHPMVCGLINTYEDSKSMYILMNLENGKELFEVLYRSEATKSGTAPVGMEYAKFLVANLVLGMGHVHSKNFVFRDLKPENIMVARNGYAKLIDFGFAKVIPPGERSFTLCGTAEYLAPEIVLGTGHDQAVDWWTVGIVAYELRTGRTPFDASSDDLTDEEREDEEANMTKEQIIRKRRNAIMSNIVSKKLKVPQDRFTEPYAEWLVKILRREDKARLGSPYAGGTAGVRDAPWLRNMDWESLLDQTLPPPRLR